MSTTDTTFLVHTSDERMSFYIQMSDAGAIGFKDHLTWERCHKFYAVMLRTFPWFVFPHPPAWCAVSPNGVVIPKTTRAGARTILNSLGVCRILAPATPSQ